MKYLVLLLATFAVFCPLFLKIQKNPGKFFRGNLFPKSLLTDLIILAKAAF